MISVRDYQRWVCVKTRRKGMIVDITGIWRGHDPMGEVLLYSNVTSSRRARGKISVWELRRNWRLVSCAHEELADDCDKCKCPFHGVEGCDCGRQR